MNALTAAALPTRLVAVLWLDIDSTVRHGKAELGRYVDSPDDVIVFPEAVERIGKWRADGGRVVGISNQVRVGLGLITHEAMTAAMAETQRQTGDGFDLLLACVHPPTVACWCQKPRGGLLSEGVALLSDLHPDECYPLDAALMVGDHFTDQFCAEDAGIRFLGAEQWRAGF